ncbi:ATP-binding protein [Nocardioides sp. CPCC 205120]|uniref:ATP-binding protein n=1 Tax=Nocardioides sp. CPCC 205120 TaxID=3406462 RepID=UPI003B5130E8
MSDETTVADDLETIEALEADFDDEGAPDPEDRLLEAADEALFGMHGATEGSTQWRIASMQLVNWGGFSGHHEVRFSRDATLLTGASGVGKSSLLDAWTTLVMPSDTRLNGASNDMTTGRARSQGQRNPLSYLRGVVDQTEDRETAQARQVTLRGSGEDTWGAVAATFVDDRERRFTALRVFYVPRRVTRAPDVVMRLATHEGPVDLGLLQAAVATRFQPRDLRALVPGLAVHETYAAFAARLYTRLGIGANGDGDKALRLLARIQASQPVRSVDELYKEMVLERPATFAAADRAVEHFDDLEGSYETMITEQQKADLLAPITDLHDRVTGAQARIDELDAYGATRKGPTPLRLWELTRYGALLDAAVGANQAAREANRSRRSALGRRSADLEAELVAAREAHRGAGGETLELLAAELRKEQTHADELRERRERLAPRVAVLDVDLSSAEDVARAQAAGRTHAAEHEATTARLDEAGTALARAQGPLLARKAELTKDRASLAGRHGRVPRDLDEIRTLLAQAAGLEELPFLAELVDVRVDEARWRPAAETVLGGAARQLLVPRERLREFSAAIDHLDLPRRITFVGADVDADAPDEQPRDRLAGKLEYRAGAFEGWVRWYLADPSRNALCVERAEDLDGPGLRVTLAGQTRSGSRGSHGRSGGSDVIGFSNTEALAALDAELAAVEAELERIDAERRDLDEQRRRAAAVLAAYQALADVPFADIDVESSLARCAELSAQRERVLAADDGLRQLADVVGDLERQAREAGVELARARDEHEELQAEQGRLVELEDATTDEREAILAAGEVVLDPEQAAALDAEFAEAVGPGDPTALDRFEEHCARLRDRLGAASRAASELLTAASEELRRIFTQFLTRWPDPNLGTTLLSYRDYADILDDIRRTGLAERRAEWQRRLTDWSGQDLVPLQQAMAAAVEEIEDRLDPINDILRRLPFGAGNDRLRIRMRRLAPTELTLFLKDLRALTAGAGPEETSGELEDRFRRLQGFMAQLRRRDDPRAGTESRHRDLLLDVRRHVEISAERYDPRTGAHQAWYRTLGEKSGGESQELVAFVIGAALRFRLGDELRSRPRFAPVFLDEGFVKADAEFAGRAVQAWRGLGFQLVVGAPFDKVTGLERHMDEFLEVVKNPATQEARVRRVVDAEEPAST